MLTVKQLFVVCLGFAFTALTICAIYVNSIGMHARYKTRTREALSEHLRVQYVADEGQRPTEKLRVSLGAGSLKTNITVVLRQRPTKEHVPEQGGRSVAATTGKSNRTQISHAANNDSSARTLPRRVPPVLVDSVRLVNGTPDPLYTHHGYISVMDHKTKLNLHCMQCALVSSSGQLLHSGLGYLIDEADCIFRMNDAPVPSYEEDVGSRTTVRVVGHAATPNLRKHRKLLLRDSPSRIVIGWGPAKPMQTNGKGYAYSHLKEVAKQFPSLDFFYLTQKQMAKADEIFEEETGMPRQGSGTYLSTGWFTMVLARAACDEIHVYGMVNDKYCQKLSNKNVPYHYYDQYGLKECSYYRAHEKGKKGFHRFMTEKSIFARWALEQPPIYFHVPDWNPK
jgi:hypothetical protein